MKKNKRKKISATKYNQIMDKIIKKNKNIAVADTLIEMLGVASQYDIINEKKLK